MYINALSDLMPGFKREINDDYQVGKQYERYHVLCANGVWVPIITSGLQPAKPELSIYEDYFYIDKRFVPPEIYKMLEPGISIVLKSVLLKMEQREATFYRPGLSSSRSQSVSDVFELEALKEKESLAIDIDRMINDVENCIARTSEFVID